MSKASSQGHSPRRLTKRAASKALREFQRIFGSRRARSLGAVGNYFRKTPAIGYAGWVGQANLGDEALYDAFVELFSGQHLICLNKPFPIELSLHSALLRGGNIFNGVMLGGGTLIFHKSYAHIMDHAQERGLPTAVFGTGVIDTEFWSQRRAEHGYDPVTDLWKKVLSRMAYIGVRGPDSESRLRSVGITNHEIIGDPALSICPPMRDRTLPQQLTVAFNLGNIGPAWGSRERIDEAYGHLCSAMIRDGHTVDFFGLHKSDAERARTVVDAYKLRSNEIWFEYYNTQKTLDRLDKYDIVVAQKLHGVVLATGLGIPCVSVAYEPKCVDYMRSIGMEDCVIQADQVSADRLRDKIDEIRDRYNELRETMRARIEHWQGRQQDASRKVLDAFSIGKTGQ
jgi:polysaccharide pyruvyl transferase WcaK-like protein